MTDYSKLSDAEIAELVCRKLGWDGGRVRLWLNELIVPGLPETPFPPNFFGHDKQRALHFACFDWPAPIMMQKVKESLDKEGYGWSINDYVKGCFQVFIHRVGWDECLLFDSNKETRALYEAFLQVDNV